MKIIQAMKQLKDLQVKAEDIRKKVGQYCADMTYETPTYGSVEAQTQQIRDWLQSHTDIVKEMARLRTAIQRTNMITEVPIDLGGMTVTKTIAEWIHRRRDLAAMEQEMWTALGRKETSMREGTVQTSTGDKVDAKIRRYYDPKRRDEMVALYRGEPMTIDANLEVINAVTDVIFEEEAVPA